MTDILQFRDDTRWLSNFEGPEVRYGPLLYPRVENAFQAAKMSNVSLRLEFVPWHVSGGAAKKLGNTYPCRPGWDQIRVPVMDLLVRQKALYPSILDRLLATDGLIREGNYWHDNFWGDCYCKDCKNVEGYNNLGKIWMQIRHEMQNFKVVFDQRSKGGMAYS